MAPGLSESQRREAIRRVCGAMAERYEPPTKWDIVEWSWMILHVVSCPKKKNLITPLKPRSIVLEYIGIDAPTSGAISYERFIRLLEWIGVPRRSLASHCSFRIISRMLLGHQSMATSCALPQSSCSNPSSRSKRLSPSLVDADPSYTNHSLALGLSPSLWSYVN
jgi:hypothetical protein